MAQWGGNDNTNNSVLWAPALVSQEINTANRDALFNNANANFAANTMKVGVFGVSAAEIKYSHSDAVDSIASIPVTTPGSGITTLGSLTLTGGGGTGANVVAIGKLVGATINVAGTTGNFAPGDTLTVAKGSGNAISDALITVSTTELRTATANATGTGYANNDTVTVQTGTGTKAILTVTTGAANTSVASLALTNRGSYTVNPAQSVVATANTTGNGTGLTVDLTLRAKIIAIANAGQYYAVPSTLVANPVTGGGGTGLTVDLSFGLDSTKVVQGGYNYTSAPTPTAIGNSVFGTVVMGARPGGGTAISHSGWVVKREGTGGRAGRVTYETLVATGSLAGDSASTDDTTVPQ